jgi:hypothetical protein
MHDHVVIDEATIELAEISTPEKILTIGIEHRHLEKVSGADKIINR